MAQDVAVIELPEVCQASIFLQGMPWVICPVSFSGPPSWKSWEHGALTVMCKSLPLFLAARFWPLVVQQRVTELQLPPFPGPGCTLNNHQHLLVLLLDLLALVLHLFLPQMRESAIIPPCCCCVFGEQLAEFLIAFSTRPFRNSSFR